MCKSLEIRKDVALVTICDRVAFNTAALIVAPAINRVKDDASRESLLPHRRVVELRLLNNFASEGCSHDGMSSEVIEELIEFKIRIVFCFYKLV